MAQSSYIGIDPSLRKTGVGILTDTRATASTLKGKYKDIPRLVYIKNQFKLQCELATHSYGPINHICIEGAAYGATNRADAQGQLRGVLSVSAHDFCSNITVVPPTLLKLYATGNGNADKDKMIRAAHTQWNLKLTDDEADALWLAHLAYALDQNPRQKRFRMEVIHKINNPKPKRRISTYQTNNI